MEYVAKTTLAANGTVSGVKAKCDPNVLGWSSPGKAWCLAKNIFLVPIPDLCGRHFEFFTYINIVIIPIYLMFINDANRIHPLPKVISYPSINGLATLVFSSSLFIPLYSIIFILGGAAHATQPSGAQRYDYAVNKRVAESTIFAFLIGYVIPTTNFHLNPNTTTYIWWFWFHPYQSALRMLYQWVMPKTSEIDTKLTKRMWAVFFVVSGLTHLYFLIVKGPIGLTMMLRPPLISLSLVPSSTWILDLFQWDWTFTWVSLTVLLYSIVNDRKEWVNLLMWMTIGIPLFGPGGFFSAVMLWREIRLTSGLDPKGLTRAKEE
ncbi:hypothetical protein VKT23_006286 [Stygiomarasmius scandens]|uniref:Wax synthase domain-containing protein n=1 Tax=Marasmiellus scandens TaxID=2682957 RepID=A0ABR1JNP8_9AGAR